MRKWLKSFFGFSDELTVYTKPVIKLLVFLALVPAIIFRPKSGNGILDGIVTAIVVPTGCLAILYCLYIPVAELFVVAANRRKKKNRRKDVPSRFFPLSQVVQLCSANDIIDLEILKRGSLIHIGSSSDLNPGESDFFDKRYYIGETEYLSIDPFGEELEKLALDGKIAVVSIDDVPVSRAASK